jgi:NitT/TauT family transport system substrate-binding protein
MPFVRTSARPTVRRRAALRGPRRQGAALALLSVALLVAACTTSGAQGGGADLTVAIVPGVDTAPLSIAVKEGLFSQQGLNVSVKQVSTTAEAYTDLHNGSADIAAGDYAGFFYAIATGESQLKLVADGYDSGPGTMQLLTLPTSSITTPADLVGKTVGTPFNEIAPYQSNFPYNIQTLATESVLQNDGVNPASVSWKMLQPSNMISALRSGSVSAILVTEPQLTEAEMQLGAVELFDSCSGVTANMPLTGYFSTAAMASRDPNALSAFQTALTQAEAAAANRSTVQSVLTSDSITTEDAALVNVGQYPTSLNVGQVQRVADLMYQSGMITTPVSVSSIQFK